MMLATLYSLPDGKQKLVEITDVDPDDAMWLTQFGVKVSLEELRTGEVAVWGDYGGDEEMLVVSKGRPCHECLAELKEKIKEKKYGNVSRSTGH